MLKINYLAVIAAAIAAFVVGALWYSPLLFGRTYMEVRGLSPSALAEMKPRVGELVGEFVKNIVVAFVLASWGSRLEGRAAVRTLGVGWFPSHAPDGSRPP